MGSADPPRESRENRNTRRTENQVPVSGKNAKGDQVDGIPAQRISQHREERAIISGPYEHWQTLVRAIGNVKVAWTERASWEARHVGLQSNAHATDTMD